MKAASIPAHEAAFHQSGIDALGKKFILTPETVKIKGTSESFTVIDCKRDNNDASFYYPEETPKKKIIIHYTMGYLKGDIATLTKGHVSVPFVIGRNGHIYNLFASKYWSYHLGAGAVGGNTAMSKECLGIELSNIGPLKKIGNNLVTTYSNTDVYCTMADTQYYVKLPGKYREYEYFATFTDAQYNSLGKLLRFLCAKYNLPKTFITEATRSELSKEADFIKFSGIATHVNCRKDKTDIGPAFNWNKLVQAVQG